MKKLLTKLKLRHIATELTRIPRFHLPVERRDYDRIMVTYFFPIALLLMPLLITGRVLRYLWIEVMGFNSDLRDLIDSRKKRN